MSKQDFSIDESMKKMVGFLEKEVIEKTRRIDETAAAEYAIEKNKIVNAMKDKISQEYERKLEKNIAEKKMYNLISKLFKVNFLQ